MIPLSVLDLSPVTTATPGSAALHNSLDLARRADSLGYKRYWLAEHHNLANIASSSPDIMIGQVAAVTSRIRVGSGGVMLPNHAPLMVAERFKVLEALFPGRIDLGLGRAPGTDPVTSYALRVRQDPRAGDEFLERFQELLLLEHGGFPDGHPFRNVRAVPSDVTLPPIWLLGSSGYSAELAAAFGLGFAFAHHFADYDAASAMRRSRSPMPFSPPQRSLRTAMPKPNASLPAPNYTTCGAPRANTCRWNRRRPLPLILTRQSIASGWRVSAPAWRLAALSPCGVACSPWPRRREPMNS